MLMRIGLLGVLLMVGVWTDGQAQEVGGKPPQAPPPLDGDFVDSPPKELLRSKNGKIELIKVLGSRRYRHGPEVKGFAFTGDGKQVVTLNGNRALKMWDYESGKELLQFEQPQISAFDLSLDGRRVLSAGQRLLVWDTRTGKALLAVAQGMSIHWAAFTTDGSRVIGLNYYGGTAGPQASTKRGTRLQIWNVSSGKEETSSTFEGAGGYRYPVLSPDRTRVLLESREGKSWTLHLIDVQARKLVWQVQCDRSTGRAGFGRDGKQIFVQDLDVLLALDPATGRTVSKSPVPSKSRFSGVMTSQGLAVYVHPEGVMVWDPAKGQERFRIPIKYGDDDCVALTPDEKTLLVTEGPAIRLWDMETGRELVVNDGHQARVLAAALMADGKRFVSAGYDLSFRTWDFSTGKCLSQSSRVRPSVQSATPFTAIAISPDGKQALSGLDEDGLKLWDVETGNVLQAWSNRARFVAFSGNGKRAFSAGDKDGMFKVWDMETYKLTTSYRCPEGDYLVSPSDGRRLLTWGFGFRGREMAYWDALTGKKISDWKVPLGDTRPPMGPGNWVGQSRSMATGSEPGWLSISPDGRYAFSIGESSFLDRDSDRVAPGVNYIWDLQAGKLIASPTWPRADCCGLSAFSPDNKRILVAGSRTLVLMETLTGKELDSIVADGGICSMRFHGDQIVVGNGDSTIAIYKLK